MPRYYSKEPEWLTSLKRPQNRLKPSGLKNILMVGNSFMFYNCGVHGMIGGLAKEKGVPMVLTMAVIGGASLSWHDVKSYLRPNGLRNYKIANDGSNEFQFIDYPDGKIFDAVVLEDSSQGPLHPKLREIFRESLRKHSHAVREAKALPILMMTWAYKDKPEMMEPLANATIEAADELNLPVVPVGIAFERVRRERPDIELIRSDNRHPTVAGTYFQAAVFFSALSGMSSEGCVYNGRYDDLRVDPKICRYLQKAAWETVRDFNGWEEESKEPKEEE